jgi:class 3 adenylate cyclase/tetratricopeptide (TPR) repeat protein
VAGSSEGGGSKGLAAYLPRVALEWADPAELHRCRPGSLVFADVSGFTALSEKLAARGSIGAEELTATIEQVFAAMLDSAYSLEGSLLKFGGDAQLLLFEGDDHEVRSLKAAQALRRAVRDMGRVETSVGRLRLRVSMGVSTGDVHLLRVGSFHRELVAAGPALTEVLTMEAAAQAGEILLSPGVAAHARTEMLGAERDGGVLLADRGRPTPAGSFPETPVPVLDPIDSIPLALRAHLLDELRTSEHRLATVGFLKWSGSDRLLAEEGPSRLAAAVDGLLTAVQEAAATCDVTIVGTDVDRDGGKVILVAGAPRAHEDDSDRMVAVLRNAVSAGGPLAARAGAHRGRVFAGDIGPEYRRTWTVMGDTVNVAARVMSCADVGQVLVTTAVEGKSFGAGVPREVTVKGKARPLRVYEPIDGSHGAAEATDLVGRDSELARLLDLAEAAQQGTGAVVEIRGEPGSGKTHLAATAVGAVSLPTHWAQAEEWESGSPWFLARKLLGPLFSARPFDADVLPEGAAGFAPLLNDVVPGSVAGDLPADLGPEERRRRTEEVAAAAFASLVDGPAIVVVDDVHSADEASAALIRRLAAAAPERGWLILLTRRGDGEPLVEWAHRLALEPLGTEEAAQLLRSHSSRILRPHEVTRLIAHARGNPLFLSQLARSPDQADLPDSLNSLLSRQIDELPAATSRLLRAASVLGVSFESRQLSELAGETVSDPAVIASRSAGLLRKEGSRLRFATPLAREAAYETLPYARRRELHGRAADLLSDGGIRHSDLAVLSLHLEKAGRWRECWKVSVVAAKQSRKLFANFEEAALLERSLLAAAQLNISRQARARVWSQLGNAWHRIGFYDRAGAAYAKARTLMDPGLDQAGLLLREARIAELQGRPTAAVRRMHRALRIVGGPTTREARLRADIEVMLGWAAANHGKPVAGLRWAERALADALSAKALRSQAESRLLREWCSTQLGRPLDVDQVERAVGIFRRLKDRARVAFTLNILGAAAYYRGDWDQAGAYYREALETFEAAGAEADSAQPRYNAAEILLDQGRMEEASGILDEVCDLYASVGYQPGLALVDRDRARISASRGDYEAARAGYAAARERFQRSHAWARVTEVDAWLADLDLREGQVAQALARVEELFQKVQVEGPQALVPMLLRTRAYGLMLDGRPGDSRRVLEECLRTARESGILYETAQTLQAAKRLAELTGAELDAEMENERLMLIERLGMQEVPAPI